MQGTGSDSPLTPQEWTEAKELLQEPEEEEEMPSRDPAPEPPSRRLQRIDRAARLVLLVEVEAAAAAPPDGPSASHRLWVTDTQREGEEGTSRKAGLEGGDGAGPQREAGTGRRVVSWEL